jgi:hypothetical protein
VAAGAGQFRYFYALDAVGFADEVMRPEWVARRLMIAEALLTRRAPSREVDILDPRWAVELFLSSVEMSVEDASELSEGWWDRDVSDIRRLRHVKNILAPTLRIRPYLADHSSDDVLDGWARVFPRLR